MFPTGGLQYPNTPRNRRPFSLFGDPSTFTSAATQQGNDYDEIMKQYSNLINNFSSNPLTGQNLQFSPLTPGSPITSNPITSRSLDSGAPITSRPITSNPVSYDNPLTTRDITSSPLTTRSNVMFNVINPQTAQYRQSGDVTDSLSKLKDLSDTGGYSAADIQNIRERDISPIRSIYASGQQNLERQKALSGGYSPNFNAVTASMARDQASKIGDITTRANADIAQNVASNKLSAAPVYASASANANAAKTAADQRNADIVNQINQWNSGMAIDVNKFNTTNNMSLDEFNKQIQLALDESNRSAATDTNKFNITNRMNTDRYNRDTQIGLDEANRNTQIGLDTSNRDIRLATDRYNRDTQLGVDTANRNTQIGLDTANRDYSTGIDQSNRDARMNTDRFNIDNMFKSGSMNFSNILDAIKGKTYLYGTTPALASLFGNQVNQANAAGQNQQDLNNRRFQFLLSRG